MMRRHIQWLEGSFLFGAHEVEQTGHDLTVVGLKDFESKCSNSGSRFSKKLTCHTLVTPRSRVNSATAISQGG